MARGVMVSVVGDSGVAVEEEEEMDFLFHILIVL